MVICDNVMEVAWSALWNVTCIICMDVMTHLAFHTVVGIAESDPTEVDLGDL